MKNNILIIFGLLLLSIITESAPIDKRENGIEKNIIFDDNMLLDVYYGQKSGANKPVIVYFYGGSWISGKKDMYSEIGNIIMNSNQIAVLPNYVLLTKGGNFDDMVDDVYKAVQWAYNNIAQYGGDKNNISIAGHSAGAHLAALTLVKSSLGIPNKGAVLSPLPQLQRAILFNGPYKSDISGISFSKDGNNGFELGAKLLNLLYGENLIPDEFINGLKNGSVSPLGDGFEFPCDLLKSVKTASIKNIGANVVRIITSSNDELIPLSASTDFINELKRISTDVKIEHEVIENGMHSSIIFQANKIFTNYIN